MLAYGIGFMSGTAGLLGWSWIFVRVQLYTSVAMSVVLKSFCFQIIEGLATIVVGAIALLGMLHDIIRALKTLSS